MLIRKGKESISLYDDQTILVLEGGVPLQSTNSICQTNVFILYYILTHIIVRVANCIGMKRIVSECNCTDWALSPQSVLPGEPRAPSSRNYCRGGNWGRVDGVDLLRLSSHTHMEEDEEIHTLHRRPTRSSNKTGGFVSSETLGKLKTENYYGCVPRHTTTKEKGDVTVTTKTGMTNRSPPVPVHRLSMNISMSPCLAIQHLLYLGWSVCVCVCVCVHVFVCLCVGLSMLHILN